MKLKSSLILVAAALFLTGLIACATPAKSGVELTAEQLAEIVRNSNSNYSSLGYFVIDLGVKKKMYFFKKKKYLIWELSQNNSLGSQYVKVKKGKSKFKAASNYPVTIELTEKALAEGAHVRGKGRYLLIPIGKVRFDDIQQQPYDAGSLGYKNKITCKYSIELNALGNEIKKLIETKREFNKFRYTPFYQTHMVKKEKLQFVAELQRKSPDHPWSL